jgi:hypothetical protein
MKRFCAILLLFIPVYIPLLNAQDVKVTAAFDSSRIYIGDQINFTVTVDKPVSLLLDLVQFKDSLKKNIEILKGPKVDTSFLKDGRLRIKQKYLVTSFDSGFYQVPPVFAEMKGVNGIKRFYSDYSNLEVVRVRITPSDTVSKIFDIVKPYRAPVTAGEILPWILLCLVLVLAIWYLAKYIKKLRMRKSGEVFVPDPDPAHVIAFRQLEQLKLEKLWEKGDVKYYYTRLSEIARLYLENRYNVFSLELTTIETLAELKKTGIREDDSFRKLKTVLTGADLVKFAKYSPEPTENELHFNYTWEYVDATKLIPVLIDNQINNEEKSESKQT